MPPLVRLLLVLPCLLSPAAASVAEQAGVDQKKHHHQKKTAANPVVGLYRKWTMMYEKDAEEAQKSADTYAQMAQAAVSSSAARTPGLLNKEFDRIGIPVWTKAAMRVEGMLNDPAPAKGAAAAAKATAPYNKAYGEYVAAQNAYNGAATGYALRSKMDAGLSKQLQSYGNQYELEGNTVMANDYHAQSGQLMTQATNFKGMANNYQAMSSKIFSVLPTIQGMAGSAGAFAAYKENPGNNLTPENVFPFTIVPPALVQVAESSHVAPPKNRWDRPPAEYAAGESSLRR